VPELQHHLDAFSGHSESGLVFPNEHGRPYWRGNFNKAVSWAAIREQLGVPTLHLHDLRHTGNTLAAQSGASLRDLMTRMGHDSPAAALIYQHSRRASDEAIAAALDAQLSGRLGPVDEVSESGRGARVGPEEVRASERETG
jgi:integrase